MKKCDICGFDTDSSKTCHNCLELTRAYFKWLEYLKKQRQVEPKHEIICAEKYMVSKLANIGTRTLKQWGL